MFSHSYFSWTFSQNYTKKYHLFRGVGNAEARYRLVMERGGLAAILNLRTGSRVLYSNDEVPATVRYLGQSPGGGLGWVLGLEVKVRSDSHIELVWSFDLK